MRAMCDSPLAEHFGYSYSYEADDINILRGGIQTPWIT
jgi:hypothetical protein